MSTRESLLVIDKEPGPTSFDIVREVKKLSRGSKVGHAGSLDPFASGVLILLLGKATKLSGALLNADKTYQATIRLGEATDTYDKTGTVVSQKEVPNLTVPEVLSCLKSFEGIWYQTPPMFSAKKVCGVRLYELARQNINVRRVPIPVRIYSANMISYEDPFLHCEIHCSKGTYVRSLADELGRRLNTVAHLYDLRRLSCGDFWLKEGVTLDRLKLDFEGELLRGYQNYSKLLRSERLFANHLPLRHPGGNSLLN